MCNIAPKVAGVWPEHWEVHLRFSTQLDFTDFVRAVMEGKSHLAVRRSTLQERLKLLELESFPLMRFRSASLGVPAVRPPFRTEEILHDADAEGAKERGVQTIDCNDSNIEMPMHASDSIKGAKGISDNDAPTAVGGNSSTPGSPTTPQGMRHRC